MRVPLTVRDHIERAALVYGERVAVVSHNSARLLTSFFGVSAYGRVLVPINFRLGAEEVRYIIEHSGASVLLVDPALDDVLADVTAEHRFVLGAESDEVLYRFDREPEAWEPDEDATATFGWHLGVNDRDVYLHTLPMFHCNGWGMVYAVTAMGGTHIVLRQADGTEILRRVDEHGVSLMCGAPTVGAVVLDAAAEWTGEIPGARTNRWVMAGAPPPTATIEFRDGLARTATGKLQKFKLRAPYWDDGDRQVN